MDSVPETEEHIDKVLQQAEESKSQKSTEPSFKRTKTEKEMRSDGMDEAEI